MVRLRALRADERARALQSDDRGFSYSAVGATRPLDDERPLDLSRRDDFDCYDFSVGTGADCFRRAREGLLKWRHFDVPWLRFHGLGTAVHENQVVATELRVAGLWFFNPCRVVYCDVPDDPARDLAFAYGTLPGHAEAGEERFRLTRDPATDVVTYQLLAFSRPAIWATKLGYPFARKVQRRFAVASAQALRRAASAG